jgi:hypothetical protein
MSESGDYDPGPWKGTDFTSARASFDAHAGRSYSDAKAKKVVATALTPNSLETKSSAPVVICCDVTASMGAWPATIFSKLGYLDNEGREYMGQDMEISYSAIGDYFSDDYPLQVKPFVAGKEMETQLKSLILEGGGGGTSEESYDFAALYYARNVDMPKAVRKPLFIFIGDEGLYTFIDSDGAEKHCHVKLKKRLELDALFKELKDKFSVYIIRKCYGNSGSNSTNPRNEAIQAQWEGLLGEDHVVSLPDPNRVVDVIFGIMAKETGRMDYFKKEIGERQKPEQIAVVMKSLKHIAVDDDGAPKSVKKIAAPGKSVTRSKSGASKSNSKPTKSLLDD